MNSRERLLKTLNHLEPDRVPFDLAGSTWTGISNGAYQNLLEYLGLPAEEPQWEDVIQQIVVPSKSVLDILHVDTHGLLHLTSHNWDVYSKLTDAGSNWEYFDEWNFTHHFPKKNGHWFSLTKNPIEKIADPAGVSDSVKRNIDALAPGGGFVFATVHNIQSEVPPKNIMTMWKTLQKHRKY